MAGNGTTAIARWSHATNAGDPTRTGYRVVTLRMSSAAPDATVLSSSTSRLYGPRVGGDPVRTGDDDVQA